MLYQLSYQQIIIKPSGTELATLIREDHIIAITAMIDHVVISFFAVKTYDLSYVHLHSSPSTGILQTRNVTSSQLAWYSVWKAVGIAGSGVGIPFRLEFFASFFSQLLKLLCNCDDQSCLHIILRRSNIWCYMYSLAFFAFYGYITNSQHDQFSVGLITQLVEHCTGILGLHCHAIKKLIRKPFSVLSQEIIML